MLKHIQIMIEELKQKVEANILLINSNQVTLKNMINQSGEYQGQYEDCIKENKTLLAQNNDFIKVQQTLFDFLEKYESSSVFEDELDKASNITDEQELFNLTINGAIVFDEKHPYYDDTEFIDKLIVYYEDQENYEQCNAMNRMKDKIQM